MEGTSYFGKGLVTVYFLGLGPSYIFNWPSIYGATGGVGHGYTFNTSTIAKS